MFYIRLCAFAGDLLSRIEGSRKAKPQRLPPLTTKTLVQAAEHLAAHDETLAWILATYGAPPMWRRPTGFPTRTHHPRTTGVVEVCEGNAAAASVGDHPFTPERFVHLGETHLRGLGVTRQKSAYLLHLSESILGRQFSFQRLARLDDREAQIYLTRMKGIGSWSADVYLLMAMRRADIWPAGDLALAVSAKDLLSLERKPTPDELETIADRWRPYRAVAARMLWQHYLFRDR